MGSLFTENIPEPNTKLQSAEIRNNFTALYDKVKSLEVRALEDNSQTIVVTGASGLIYFRSSTNNQLTPIPFPGDQLNLNTTIFYKTKKNQDGSLKRELQSFTGPSNFLSEGSIVEILLSLDKKARLIITESLKGQNNRLSSAHYNLFFDDSEIPLALIFLEKNNDGTLKSISQTDIRDIRPFVTSAFQNNPQTADLENTLNSNTSRIQTIEPSIKITNNLLVRLPSSEKLQYDNKSSTNTQVEVLSGRGWIGTNSGTTKLLKFAGCYVDFSRNPAISTPRVISANTPSMISGYWNKAIIALQYNPSSSDPTENSQIIISHGTENISLQQVVLPSLTTNTIPLACVIYRMSGSDIIPLVSFSFLGDTQLSCTFPIVEISSTSLIADLSQISTSINSSTITTEWFPTGGFVDLDDSNTLPIRRKIETSSFNTTTKLLNLTLVNSFSDLSLDRTPYVKSVSKHIDLIEDLRPFVGIG